MEMTVRQLIVGAATGVVMVALIAPLAHAAETADSELTQRIEAGTISTSIRDAAGDPVAAPSFSMGSVNASTSVQTANGTFGDNAQRITVDNPGGANNGWSLALAATGGASATWTNGTDTYPFNGTTTTGQLSIDPSAGVLTAVSGTTTNVTKGTSGTFSAASPITLLTASDSAEKVWNGYLTGVGVSQVIPASTPVGTYTIDLTQTVTAL